MRLDMYLVEFGFYESRNKAKYEIENGNVLVNSNPITKPAYELKETDVIECIKENELKYVSKGGLKLEKALSEFSINPNGLSCLDIGSSTGGFTDCLLKNGAKEVYSVDTGTMQLHESLRNLKEVHLFESTNFLTMDLSFKETISIITIDVSFIKIEPILDRIIREFDNVTVIGLIKPQFEVEHKFFKNGVIKDPKIHKRVIEDVKLYLSSYGINKVKITDSPILGGSGNKEFLMTFSIKK